MASGLPVADTPTPELIRLMTGRNVEYVFPPRRDLPADAPVVLDVDGLGLRGIFDRRHASRCAPARSSASRASSGRVAPRSSRPSTARAAPPPARSPSTATGSAPGSVTRAVDAGIGLSPEERKSQGLLLDEPIFQNVTLSTFARFARGAVLNERRERAATREQIEALELRPADPDRITGTLSGGNQQKILLARWLVHGTKVLLLDEPTRGVDVGARAEIYALIRRLADAGTAIVVVSSEIEEVLGLADRVLVIADGRVLHITPPPRSTSTACSTSS